ncbi:MAG: ABC transporter permease [Spirosomataceae bacterium]
MVRNYLKIAFRNLLKNKTYSIVNIMGLAIGLAVAILMLLYVKDDLSYDRFHSKNPNIYRVVSDWYHPDGSLGHRDGLSSNLQGQHLKRKYLKLRSLYGIQVYFETLEQRGR